MEFGQFDLETRLNLEKEIEKLKAEKLCESISKNQ